MTDASIRDSMGDGALLRAGLHTADGTSAADDGSGDGLIVIIKIGLDQGANFVQPIQSPRHFEDPDHAIANQAR